MLKAALTDCYLSITIGLKVHSSRPDAVSRLRLFDIGFLSAEGFKSMHPFTHYFFQFKSTRESVKQLQIQYTFFISDTLDPDMIPILFFAGVSYAFSRYFAKVNTKICDKKLHQKQCYHFRFNTSGRTCNIFLQSRSSRPHYPII
jgi:hypothetical protein